MEKEDENGDLIPSPSNSTNSLTISTHIFVPYFQSKYLIFPVKKRISASQNACAEKNPCQNRLD